MTLLLKFVKTWHPNKHFTWLVASISNNEVASFLLIIIEIYFALVENFINLISYLNDHQYVWIRKMYCICVHIYVSSVQFSHSVMSDSLRPHNCSTSGLPVHLQVPEITQTHVHRVGDAIQTSHLLSSHVPPALNPSQHQNLFQWVNSLHGVAKVLEFQL